MGSIFAGTIISNAASDLHDVAHNHWPEAELLGFLNEAQRAICERVPSAYTATMTFELAQGAVQYLPADANTLVRVNSNIGASRLSVLPIDELSLRIEDPDWVNPANANAVVENYIYDLMNPREFLVVPPQPAVSPGALEIVVSKTPPNVVVGAPIALSDTYEPAIRAYLMFMALSREGVGQATEKAQAYFQVFANSMRKK